MQFLSKQTSKMKNILQVVPEFGLAGAETMCESLCYQILESGKYNLYVASLFDFHSPITERLESKNIKIFYIGKKRGLDLTTIMKLSRIMKQCNIEIVHTHRYVMQYVIPAAILARVPVRVHTIHNIATKEVDGFRRKLAHLFYGYCNVIPVSISPIVQKTVIEEYKITAQQTPVVFNGSDLSKCQRKTDYTSAKPFRFVHIGRFNSQKNHGVIIEAALLLKNEGFKFVINLIGGAGNEEERKKEVKEKGLDDVIIFSGLQSNVYPFLHESDCFILPSTYEGMPITLVEAMGCGLPIIASAVGGVPDMITNEETGILIKPTVEDLTTAMKRVMSDENLRETIGTNALKSSQKFTSEQMFRGYDNIYENTKS